MSVNQPSSHSVALIHVHLRNAPAESGYQSPRPETRSRFPHESVVSGPKMMPAGLGSETGNSTRRSARSGSGSTYRRLSGQCF